MMLLVYLPETLRRIAGNGTLRLSGVYQPFIRRLTKEPEYMEDAGEKPEVPKVTFKTFAGPIKLLAEKDIMALLVSGGMVYTIWSMVIASTTGIFKDRFGLNELMLGLVFLPNGEYGKTLMPYKHNPLCFPFSYYRPANNPYLLTCPISGFGTIVGSSIAGKIMTKDFVRFEQLYLETHPAAPAPSKSRKAFASDFPMYVLICHGSSTTKYRCHQIITSSMRGKHY